MFDHKISADKFFRAAVLVLAAAVIVLGFVTCKAQQEKNELHNTVTELCSDALTDIELNLRQGDPIASEHLLRYHQITRVYPDTNYYVLAEVMMPLTDTSISSLLTQSQRNEIADCLTTANDPEILDYELEPLIYQIESVIAACQYK